jgi:DNA topoisomerase-1
MSGKGAKYVLVVCEKPDAAKRVSEALSDGPVLRSIVDGVPVFSFERANERFVVCAARGHLYGISDLVNERTVYPVFDLSWFPKGMMEKDARGADNRIAAIRRLASNASDFVNACDYDTEGETIGYNILQFACGGKAESARRAKFSTLTREELDSAFKNAVIPANNHLAIAGRTRHVIDFLWGVNFSRSMSQSLSSVGHRFRTISIGRVQGPTLNFVVEREKQIQSFVPVPYWKVRGNFEARGVRFGADCAHDRIRTMAALDRLRSECQGKDAVVSDVTVYHQRIAPPPAFNLGDLQREAYRVFGFSPSKTLEVAERLYLDALLSYPRTSSQKLPRSIGYAKIMAGLSHFSSYSKVVAKLLGENLEPVQGSMDDSAHPAIYPTGERPRRALSSWESKLYDLVARRFLAAFAPYALRQNATVKIMVGDNEFVKEGRKTLVCGWLEIYNFTKLNDVEVPMLQVGDRLRLLSIESEERFERPPPRYNQSTLLEKMEREGIGTKGTRAETIATLIRRGYIAGEDMCPTELGFSVTEMMSRFCPELISTEMTKRIEERLRLIESGTASASDLLRENVRVVAKQLIVMKSNEEGVGGYLGLAARASVLARIKLGACPLCRSGSIVIVKSKRTGKRFAGCTGYSDGCRASAPLPQRGVIRSAGRACGYCSWPVVYVLGGRHPWRLCINMACPSRVKKNELRVVQKGSR